MRIILFGSSLIVAVVCLVLVLHQDYEDGFLGRAALGIISTLSFLICARLILGWLGEIDHAVSPGRALLWLALAVFFARHLWRFERRRDSPERPWHAASPRASAGKRKADAQ